MTTTVGTIIITNTVTAMGTIIMVRLITTGPLRSASLNVGFATAEAVYGYLAGSLALVADAGHNFSDVLGLLLAWGAAWLSQKRPSERRTYGLRSSSILAAMFNAVLLLVAIGAITWEAIRRFSAPAPVAGTTIIWVAFIGIIINTATALLFMSGRKDDLNIRGAFLHMAADAAVSAGRIAGRHHADRLAMDRPGRQFDHRRRHFHRH